MVRRVLDYTDAGAVLEATIGDLLSSVCSKGEICRRAYDIERCLGQGEDYKVDVPKEMSCLLPAGGSAADADDVGDVSSSILAALKQTDDDLFVYHADPPSKELDNSSSSHSSIRPNDSIERSGSISKVPGVSSPMAALLASLGWGHDGPDYTAATDAKGEADVPEKYLRMSCILCGVSANVPIVKSISTEANVSVIDGEGELIDADCKHNGENEKVADAFSSDSENLKSKTASAGTCTVTFGENASDIPPQKRRRLEGNGLPPSPDPMQPLAHHRYFCPMICKAIRDDEERHGDNNPAWKVILSQLVSDSTSRGDIINDDAAKLLQTKANVIIANVLGDII
uniref:Uncharacterized protein n=1 Tax=Leptocylindrus danicus TaxID=163516 RepID=A0A7S2L180_9STRA